MLVQQVYNRLVVNKLNLANELAQALVHKDLLLPLKDVWNIKLGELFISVIDAKLFETVNLEDFESEYVQETYVAILLHHDFLVDPRHVELSRKDSGVQPFHQPVEESIEELFGQRVSSEVAVGLVHGRLNHITLDYSSFDCHGLLQTLEVDEEQFAGL